MHLCVCVTLKAITISVLLVQTNFVTEPKAKLNCCYPWTSTRQDTCCCAPALPCLSLACKSTLSSTRQQKKKPTTLHKEGIMYLHTLLHLNPAVLVVVHHLMDAPQGFKAVAVGLAQTWWRHRHAGIWINKAMWRYFVLQEWLHR